MKTRRRILTYLLVSVVYVMYIVNVGFSTSFFLFPSEEEAAVWNLGEAIGWVLFVIILTFLYFMMVYFVWDLGKKEYKLEGRPPKYKVKKPIFKRKKTIKQEKN